MKPVMLDTDILSEYFRGNPKVIENMQQYLQEYNSISLSIITYYEILNGLLYKDAKNQIKKFYAFTELNNIIPLTTNSVKISATLQAEFRKKGTVIGHTDTLIAGVAIANDLQLVTNNTKHFKGINALEIVNWKTNDI